MILHVLQKKEEFIALANGTVRVMMSFMLVGQITYEDGWGSTKGDMFRKSINIFMSSKGI
jgi:hypothetical protein